MPGPHTYIGVSAGTWDIASAWDTNLIPGVGEDLIFDGNALYDIKAAPNAAKDYFGKVVITKAFAKEFGGAAFTVPFDAATATDELIIDAINIPTYLKLSGKFSRVTVLNAKNTATACLLSGTFASLNINKGTVTMLTGSIITDLNTAFQNAQLTDAKVTIPAGCTITNIYQRGGVILNSSAIAGVLAIDIGSFTQSLNNIASLNLRGGTFNWNAGIITLANLFAGTFDCRGATVARTLVRGTMWSNVTAYFNSRALNIEFLNPMEYNGGTITLDKGSLFDINLPWSSASPSSSISASPSASVSASISSSPSASTSTSASISSSPSASTSTSASISSSPSASVSSSISSSAS